MPSPRTSPLVYGVDFTSAPRRAKPITVACGRLDGDVFTLDGIDSLESLNAYEEWLRQPRSWIGGFDFPFGLPREAVLDLGWPQDWPALTRHCRDLGRGRLRDALDAHRAARPVGNKFCFRRGDAAAGSHSPLKLVNPPVALMFLEGAPRLPEAGVTVPGMHVADSARIALEAYPGYAVRQILHSRARVSYKNDAPGKQSDEHRRVRLRIVDAIAGSGLNGVRLRAVPKLIRTLVDDGRGDRLDAVLCALQAAWGYQRRDRHYGLPRDMDPVEGWIVTVPPWECAGSRALFASGPRGDSGNIRA